MAEKKEETPLLLNNVRLSYFYGFKPYQGEDGKPSYCAHLIIPRDHPQLSALTGMIKKVAKEVFGVEADQVLATLKAQDKLCLHNGDITKAGQEAYAGKLYVSANNKIKPRIVATVGGINQEIDESSDFAPYSGCKANAVVIIWAQNNKWGKRINAQLTGVQFVAHDKRLGGGGKAASLDEFGVVATDADGAAPADDDIAF